MPTLGAVLLMVGSDVVGDVPSEVALLVDHSMTPVDALAAGSTAARAYLGLPAVQAGASADLVTYARPPRGPSGPAHPRSPCGALAAG